MSNIKVTFDLTELQKLKDNLKNLTVNINTKVDDSEARKSASGIQSLFTGVAAGISASLTNALLSGIQAGMRGLTDIVGDGINKALTKESNMALLTATLKGSTAEANRLYAAVKQVADVSPFDTSSLLKATQAFINAGDSADLALSKTKQLLNAASGSDNPNQTLTEMASARSKNDPSGRWMTEDLNQLQDRAVPIYKALADLMNTNVANVRKMASEGKITADVVSSAFDMMNAKGGVLNGRMEALGATTKGLGSTMQDAFDGILVEGGAALQPAIKAGTQFLTEVANKLKDSGMFDEVLEQSTAFANYLSEHQELVGQVATFIKEGVGGGLHTVVEITKGFLDLVRRVASKEGGLESWQVHLGAVIELMGTLSKAMLQLGEWTNNFVKGLSDAAAQLANLVSIGKTPLADNQVQGTNTGNDEIILAATRIAEGRGANIALENRAKGDYGGFGASVFKQAVAPGQFAAFDWASGQQKSSEAAFVQALQEKYGKAALADAMRGNANDFHKDSAAIGNRTSFRTTGSFDGSNSVHYAGNSYLNEERWDGVDRRPKASGSPNIGFNTGNTYGPAAPSGAMSGKTGLIKAAPSISGTLDASGQNGGDFDVGPNGEMYNYMDGIVTELGTAGNNGNYVVVSFVDDLGNQLEATYSHVAAKVRKGQKVVAGEVIGTFDASGRTFGAHNSLDINTPGTNGALQRSQESEAARRAADLIVKGNAFSQGGKGSGGASFGSSMGTADADAIKAKYAAENKAAADAAAAMALASKEQAASWAKADAETKAARAKRDADIKIEDNDLKTLYTNELALLDKKADLDTQLYRAKIALDADTKANPQNIKINASKLAEVQASHQAELITLQTQIEAASKEVAKKLELQKVEAEKYTLSLKLRKDQYAESQKVEAETDVIRKATATYQQQAALINEKYKQEQKDIDDKIIATEKLIEEYKRLGKSDASLAGIKASLQQAKDYSVSQQGMELGGAANTRDTTQRNRVRELEGNINSQLSSSMDAYNQRTMSTDQYNAYKRETGKGAITAKYNQERSNIEAIKDLDPAKYEQILNSINQLENVDISNLNNQFKTLGQTITESVVQGLGQAFSSIIDGSQTAGQAMLGFLKSVAKQLLDMAMNQLIKGLLGKLFGGMGGGGGGIISSFLGGGGFSGATASIPGFATGGVVSSPTLAMVGEGSYNEAVVPLPNGKSIPVQLGGSMGGGGAVSSNVTVNVSNSGQMSNNNASGFGKEIESAVQAVIAKAKRPGGSLYARA